MKRVLFLSQVVPFPTDAGPKMRSYYNLRHLAQNYQVTLLAFSRPDDKPEAQAHLASICERVEIVPMQRSRRSDAAALVLSFLSGKSFVIRRDTVSAMNRKIEAITTSMPFDAIHVDQLWMAQYALRILRSTLPGIMHPRLLVLDEHNACFVIFKRLAAGVRDPLKRLFLEREWRVLACYEAQTCRSFNHVVCVTEEDRAILQPMVDSLVSLLPSPTFATIPICVDPQENPLIVPVPGPPNVLHMGTMFFLPNVEGVLWFAREVWPRVLAQVPNATFSIVGKNPPAEIRGFAAQPSIKVAGYVADPQPYLQQARAFVVPLLSGGGMRVKIMDAGCRGIPIVSTPIGVEGICHRDGENLLIANDAASFAQSVVRILNDAGLAERLRCCGREWVDRHYNWRNVYQDWNSIYEVSQH